MMSTKQFIKPFGIGAVIALAVVGGAIFGLPLLAQHAQPSPYSCPAITFIPTSIEGSGFLMSKHTGYGANGMQFVMKPNSTAFINMTYFTGGRESAQSIYANRSRYFVPIQYLSELPPSNHSANDLSSSQSGVIIAPVNVAVNGNNTLSVIYEASASASAMKASYIVGLPETCGPQVVLTVGNSFYNGPGLTGGAYS
jgi:hypothetical protein